jgi:hypothetical protein
MYEHMMLEIARQRAAEWQESARLARLARLAREQRAVDRARRARVYLPANSAAKYPKSWRHIMDNQT